MIDSLTLPLGSSSGSENVEPFSIIPFKPYPALSLNSLYPLYSPTLSPKKELKEKEATLGH